MKKLASVLILVFAFTLTTQAQKKRKRIRKEKFNSEQQATITVKKMALALELSKAQQRKLKPILKKQIAERRAHFEKMKKNRGEKKRIETDERYKRVNEVLDKRLAMQEEMKSILNAEQYEKFKKMNHARKRFVRGKIKKRVALYKKRKHSKERKHKKRKHPKRDREDH